MDRFPSPFAQTPSGDIPVSCAYHSIYDNSIKKNPALAAGAVEWRISLK